VSHILVWRLYTFKEDYYVVRFVCVSKDRCKQCFFFFQFFDVKFFATLPPKLRKNCQNYNKKTKISGSKKRIRKK
jgi:hypothetical protein